MLPGCGSGESSGTDAGKALSSTACTNHGPRSPVCKRPPHGAMVMILSLSSKVSVVAGDLFRTIRSRFFRNPVRNAGGPTPCDLTPESQRQPLNEPIPSVRMGGFPSQSMLQLESAICGRLRLSRQAVGVPWKCYSVTSSANRLCGWPVGSALSHFSSNIRPKPLADLLRFKRDCLLACSASYSLVSS